MTPRAWYNEIDPFAAAWLRELIKNGLVAPGDVDERSITDVRPEDLDGYTQCHFFAGIGGWSYALRLAGWPDDRPVWTGSCPCQPFSAAGKQKGHEDARHLWPEFLRLIRERCPATIFGEQVAGAIGHGWIDGVCVDLEAEDYAIGQIVFPSCGVGAPHIRQRMWWVADAGSAASERGARRFSAQETRVGRTRELNGDLLVGSSDGRKVGALAKPEGEQFAGTSQPGIDTCEIQVAGSNDSASTRRSGSTLFMGDAYDARPQRHWQTEQRSGQFPSGPPSCAGFWDGFDLIPCRDGKSRRVEPGTFTLAHGIPARVGRLRGYGNAINPEAAAQFVGAYLDVLAERGAA